MRDLVSRERERPGFAMNGLLVIDKPGGMTSRDAVNLVQRVLPRKTKIGHTGTLDPLATGVLVICVGAATRLADYVQAMGKSYTSRFRLGATSSTDDADGTVTESLLHGVVPTRNEVERALASFVGPIEQLPPAFSALKVGGQRAHDLARAGKTVELKPRTVRVDAIRLVRYEWPFVDVEVDCGKGTYIRSIARDVGDRLIVGGMVQTLRRTRVGPFTPDQAIDLQGDVSGIKLQPMLMAVRELPRVHMTSADTRLLRQGQIVRCVGEDATVAVVDETNELILIGRRSSGELRPEIVFKDAQHG